MEKLAMRRLQSHSAFGVPGFLKMYPITWGDFSESKETSNRIVH